MQKKTGIRTKGSSVRLLAKAALVLCLVSLQGCKHDKEKAAVLAQVGTSTLTLAELRESFPVEFEQFIRREQYLDFVKRWIDDEVIYQQAQKADLAKDSSVARKLAKVRRKLLIEEFLARENASEVFEPDEISMNQYYEMHKEEFRRKVPEVKFIHLRAQSSKQASDLRSKINRGDFLAIAAANSLDPAPESYASIGFKKQSEFPPCLTQDIASANVGAVTLPIACPDGFYLVKVLERQEAGSLISFAEAKEEISGILIMDRKDKLLEGRIAKYKEGLAIGYNLDQIPGQSETSKPGEAQTTASPKADAKAPEHEPTTNATTLPQPTADGKASAGTAANGGAAAKNAEAIRAAGMAAAMPQEPSAARMPREPWEDKQAAPTSHRAASNRKRNASRSSQAAHANAADSAGARDSSPSARSTDPAADPAPISSTGSKPEAEENSNAQKPEETP